MPFIWSNQALALNAYAALLDETPGSVNLKYHTDFIDANGVTAYVKALNGLYPPSYSTSTMAADMLANLGLTSVFTQAQAEAYLDSAANRVEAVLVLAVELYYYSGSDAGVKSAQAAYVDSIEASYDYSIQPANVSGAELDSLADTGTTFALTEGTVGTADIMRLTGDMDARVDLTANDNQIKGLDLDGDGVIERNGVEYNNPTALDDGRDFEVVDAYSRNPMNQLDKTANFLGDIAFDGTGFVGDGVNTDGNIFLGGLGADAAFGGIGNDFMTGGGIAAARTAAARAAYVAANPQDPNGTNYTAPVDTLSGGRNADFFYAELSDLDATDGDSLVIDGGVSADDNSAGITQSAQDADWMLLEASDDDEPVTVRLRDDTTLDAGETAITQNGSIVSRAGVTVGTMRDIENFDASGNLYGFLDGIDVSLGGKTAAYVAGQANNGIGSSAQLNVIGSEVANIIIGGYDNDRIEGNGGNDILLGGNLAYLANPNLVGIVNDGRDELIGGAGNDNIVFEADGGIIEGDITTGAIGVGDDTLWLTNLSLGTKTAADLTTDGVVRIDLDAQDITASSGYGGADAGTDNGTADDSQDQTNYKAGVSRTQVQDMDNVYATGLGAIDYDTDGTNVGDVAHLSQVNIGAYAGNLDLRGTAGVNVLYANSGNDTVEGRAGGTQTFSNAGVVTADGRDKLSGGDGIDTFIFGTTDGTTSGVQAGYGDGVDVIHRQADTNADNIWDGYDAAKNTGNFVQDFGVNSVTTAGSSSLVVDFGATNLALADVAVTSFTIKIGGVTFSVTDAAALAAANNASEVATLVNAAFHAQDAAVTATAVGNTVVVTDAAGHDISDTIAEGYLVGIAIANGAASAQATFNPAGSSTVADKLVYASYEDRADGELTDDDAVLGSHISLGQDSYAEDRVVDFSADGTRIAEDQIYNVVFTNLTTQDKVTVMVNGVNYALQVGVDLDGNIVAAEDGIGGDTQAGIQAAFLNRLNSFINSFMDDDTGAGKVASTFNGTNTLTLTQADYTSAEETVFMKTPTVTLENLSGGQVATAVVVNNSQHEVQLLDFNGRDGNLNAENVLFLGNTGVSQSILATAKNAGGTLNGSEADLVDGGANDLANIAQNLATNAALATNFAVHGDDLLIGGTGADIINGMTGDDRVLGSLGADTIDGGKSYYAVQVLGEAEARVFTMNAWEAANPTLVTALNGLTISSINRIDQAELGSETMVNVGLAEVFNDTLQFQQNDFTAGASRFTVTLNNFQTVAGVVQLRNGGAGTVGVDNDGNGTIDATTTFTNFENIRTISGTGNAVAGDGQGNDTLDISALSAATGGVSYDLTNRTVAAPTSTAGDVRYSTNVDTADGGGDVATALFADENDFETAVIKVDGVESVIAGLGNDLLMIDETEAAKNNSFSASLGNDRVQYLNDYVAAATAEQVVALAAATAINSAESIAASATYVGVQNLANANAYLAAANALVAGTPATLSAAEVLSHQAAAAAAVAAETSLVSANAGIPEPTVTIKVNSASDTDTVTMTAGRVGTTVATDTLVSVERIALNGDTAEGSRENDVLDVTTMATGAVVDFTTGQVRDLNGVIQVTIEEIAELENVWADGNDTVIVADNMGALSAREDTANATASKDIALATFLDYDELSAAAATLNKRVAFANQTTGQIENVVNQNQYTFSMSKVGTDADSDTVDYSGTLLAVNDDNISVRVELDANQANQYVTVDTDGATFFDAANDLSEAGDRIDVLNSVERVVASTGESVLDLTASTKSLEIVYQALDVANRVAVLDRDVYNVQISDLSSSVPLTRNYVEYRDAGLLAATAAVPNQVSASWNRIEGSDFAERVVMNSAHSANNNTMNLRGGANEVKYNELTRSITTTLAVVDYAAANALNTGKITATVQFQDGTGAGVEGPMLNATTDVITSYTANNGIATGSLRIAASQDAEDTLKFAGLSDKLFLISETGTTDNQITVKIGSGAAENSIILTGFELISDAAGNDVYDFGSIINAGAGLNFIDAAGDHDTVKVGNDATNAAFGGTTTSISLAGISAAGTTLAAAGFDFDVLDVTKVTDAAVTTLIGVAAGEGTDEVVLGALNGLTTINFFESVVLTQATVTGQGTTYVLNTTANSLTAGAKTLQFNQDMNTLSFGGLALEDALGDSTSLNVASGVTVTTVGNESVTLIGGNGNDTLSAQGGNDTFVGGQGNDTLDGARTAAIGEIATITLGGGAAVLAGVQTVTLTGNVATLTIGASGSAGELKTVTATADADQIGALLMAQTNTFLETELGYAAGSIASKAYDAGSNVFTLTFAPAAGNVANLASAVTGGSTMTAVAGNTAGAAAIESRDTYAFEATAALNGVDTINNFNLAGAATDDRLDFSKFIGGTYDMNGAVNGTAGVNLGAGVNTDIAVVFNKGTLTAADIVSSGAFAAGKIGVADNGKAVVIVTADDNGAADIVSNDAYKVYYVEDTDATAAQTFVVTQVATLNSAAELNAGAFANLAAFRTGTAAADTLTGTTSADTIQGNAGNDVINLVADTAADTVIFAAKADGTVMPFAGVSVADTVENFVSANDQIVVTGALKGLLDDITVDNTIVFTSAAGGNGFATLTNLVTTTEALFISSAENGVVTAANLGNKVAVITEFNTEFTETVAAGGGSDALLILEASDLAGTFGVYAWTDDIGDGFDAFDELVLLGIVTGDAVATGNFDFV